MSGEFIGDGVLNCTIALALYEKFPELPEGSCLTCVRTWLASRHCTLWRSVSTSLQHIRIGEARKWWSRTAIHACRRAGGHFGAILLDSGFDAAQDAINRLYVTRIAQVNPREGGKDAKTRLQEFMQSKHLACPHIPLNVWTAKRTRRCSPFAAAYHRSIREAVGRGSSRRAAEQQTANAVLNKLGSDMTEPATLHCGQIAVVGKTERRQVHPSESTRG